MLKVTQVHVELFDDIEMIMFMECGIRGGISQCSNPDGENNKKRLTILETL